MKIKLTFSEANALSWHPSVKTAPKLLSKFPDVSDKNRHLAVLEFDLGPLSNSEEIYRRLREIRSVANFLVSTKVPYNIDLGRSLLKKMNELLEDFEWKTHF